MNTRPIHTLAEDFEFLGLVDEMDTPDAPAAPPKPDKKALAMQKKMNVAKSKMAALQKKAIKAGMAPEDVELAMAAVTEDELDMIPEGEDLEQLDEFKIIKFFKNLLKKGKKKPSRAERLEKAKKAKRYRKGRGKSQAKRYRKSSRFKKLKKLYAKAKKMGKKAVKGGRRSFASMLGSSTEHPGQDLSELGSIINALEHTEDSSQYAEQYTQIARAATATAKGFRELDEGYVDIHFPLDEAADYCDLIAAEAREFLDALKEREGTISVEDQQLLDDHLGELYAEALAMANYADDTEILAALDEGRMPYEQEVVESEGLFGATLDEDEDSDLFEDEDEDEEDPFDGIRGEVALMFGIRRR